MKPDFSNASESFKNANPHLFPTGCSEQDLNLARPPDEIPQSKEEVKNEKELQEQIRGYLEQNNTVVIRSRMDKKTGTPVGTPDLLFAVRGMAVAFEVKLPGRRTTPEQDKMMKRMSANGWSCFVVYSFDEAIEIYRKLSS